MDYEICRQRHRSRRDRLYAARDRDEGWALHNQITEAESFEQWFYEDSCFPNLAIKPEEIAPAWRDVC
jgi:hypothetical protein